jgi:hypothetical protein
MQYALLPDVTYFELITSYVESERLNANGNFLRTFGLQAQASGHKVVTQRVVTSRPEGVTDTCCAERMISAMPFASMDEYEEIMERMKSMDASEEDKWRVYTAGYKRAWCIDKIDAEFLKEHGTYADAFKVTMLCRILAVDKNDGGWKDTSMSKQCNVLKVPYIIDTIKALGLSSPFDTKLVINDLWELFKNSLLPTPFFKGYIHTAPLFNKCTRGMNGEWDLKKTVKAVNMVLGAAGLGLVGKRSRAKKTTEASTTDAGERAPEFTYKMDVTKVDKMMELVKLRMLRRGFRASDERVHALIMNTTVVHYARLFDEETPNFSTYAFRNDDVEMFS